MTPLVTVTIPTINRRDLFKRALDCYRNQTYSNLELIVIESESRNIDLLGGLPRCRYTRGNFRNLAQKRNYAAKIASGEFICHFDDDDWSGPNRISDQLDMFSRFGGDIVGYNKVYWWDSVRKVASHYRGSIWGASIMYRREYALKNPFDESVYLAEDCKFINSGSTSAQSAEEHMVCTMHSENAVRNYHEVFWPIVPFKVLPEAFRKTLEIV